tara:strand:+ start:1401 stop:2327 length:927 start_codon:yes stop_codon:yes gene_type:complete
MNWKIKSIIQNIVSFLPTNISYELYYKIQRNFGELKNINPESRIKGAIDIFDYIRDADREFKNKIFFEVGTGRIPIIPIALWIMGAKKIYTVDVNPYLKIELIKECIDSILENQNYYFSLFGERIYEKRLSELIFYFSKNNDLELDQYLNFFNIYYMYQIDKSKFDNLNGKIDYHISFTVLEHVPKKDLFNIFDYGNKIVKKNGIFIHRIDYSDHFSHSDNKISSINFLKYSDIYWKFYGDNKYMYTNRLRHDDFLEFYNKIEHKLLKIDLFINKNLDKRLLKLDKRFQHKDNKVIQTEGSWIISEKK